MGLLNRRTTPPAPPQIAASRTLPSGVTAMGTAALALAGLTADPYTASPVTRAQALSWPALNNGIRFLTNIASQLPLKAESDLGVSDDTRTFLKTLDPAVPPGWTIAKTVESLICHPKAYWLVTSRYATRFPRTIEYVDYELVSEHSQQTGDGVDRIDHYRIGTGDPIDKREMIVFPGILPGILTVGAASIRTALANIHAARMYAENPNPSGVLEDADGAETLETDDALAYLEAMNVAVRTHGNAYLGGLKFNPLTWSAKEIQLVEARHADSVEAARLLSLPTFYVAAPNQGSSLTYSNQIDVRRDAISALASFAGPATIEGRLSMPDVTPAGTTVHLDSASFYQQVTPSQPDGATRTNQPNQQTPNTQPESQL